MADTGTDEVQELEIDATGGTFPVTFAGDTTDPELDFDADPEDVAAAVIAASDTLEEGDLEVTGGPGDAGGNTPYVFTFASRLGNVGQITSSGSNLTGGAGTATPSTTTPGVAPTTVEVRVIRQGVG